MSRAQDEAVEDLINRLDSRRAEERVEAREALAQMGSTVTPRLIQVLREGTGAQRMETARALEAIADPRAAEALIDALEDENSSVRWLAGDALIALRGDAVVPLLRTLLARSESAWIREGTHRVLSRITTPETASVLTPIIRDLEHAHTADLAVLPEVDAAIRYFERNGA